MKHTLFYIHDPMCSWCWGFTQTLNELLEHLPENIEVKRILGGLAPDTDISMPEGMQEQIKSNWLRIEETIPGIKFNFEFWKENTPRRSTYPACRAVIAARLQGEENDVLMTKAIQKAYYQQARNPSDIATLVEIAAELNLSVEDFKNNLLSDEVQKILIEEIELSRELFAESYPSLVLKTDSSIVNVPINYTDISPILNKITKFLSSRNS